MLNLESYTLILVLRQNIYNDLPYRPNMKLVKKFEFLKIFWLPIRNVV